MKRRNAFTLIELLVVIAIIAVLAVIGVPAYRRAIDTSQRSQCVSNLRSIYTAMVTYAFEHNGLMPSTRRTPLTKSTLNDERYAGALILLEAGYLPSPKTFVCPSDKEPQRKVWDQGKHQQLYTSYFAYRDQDSEGRDRKMLDRDQNFGMNFPVMGDAAKSNFHVTGYNTCFPDGHIEFLPADAINQSPYKNINFFWE